MADTASEFDDVFKNDGSDMGANAAAPGTDQTPRDEAGRFAEKQPDAPPPADATAPPARTETPPNDNASRHVPLSELLSEREKRKAEATRREEVEKRNNDLQAQLEVIARMQQAPRPPQAPPHEQQEELPDPYDAPAVMQYQLRQLQRMQQQFNEQQMHQNANFSERLARQQHGNEAVEAAIKAAQAAGAGTYFLRQQDPYGALMQWHNQQSFLAKVGSDPQAYEKSIEQRAYERALADLKAGKAPAATGRPASTPAATRFPGSLADATQSGSQGAVLTDEAIAAELFDTNRNRRAH